MRTPSILIALLASLSLAACGKPLKPPTGPLPANLRQPCPPLPLPPKPLVGEARDLWEAAIITLYGECAARHLAAIKATE